jgi:hypothetical protein
VEAVERGLAVPRPEPEPCGAHRTAEQREGKGGAARVPGRRAAIEPATITARLSRGSCPRDNRW